MRKFKKNPCPNILLESHSKRNPKPRWVVYGEMYHKKRQDNPSFEFIFPQIKGLKLNRILVPILMKATDNHCSYCDDFPLLSADKTIDHFKPKSKFYNEVCQWENLYIACGHCQNVKASQFDDMLLRPDDEDYDFHHYFVYDYSTHKICVRDDLVGDKLERAEITHKILDFNYEGMVESRRLSYDGFVDKPNYPKELLKHRFIFE